MDPDISLGQCPTELHAAFLNGFPIPVERVLRQAYDLAGPGNIARLLSQIQQAKLVFDDAFATMQHEDDLNVF